MRIPDTYYTEKTERVPECNADALTLYHKKSGARLFILKNDDTNRVFTIGFRTPPHDSTGLPHILEHSVLCGSEKFPVKDPFIEMEKSSLQTFLNAMTYPDKTIYPVASCNEKDFRNLMDVYMDAVLRPAIYRDEKIFRQEGWHYELEDADSPLIINGVVYNEMKGAFSSPDDVLERYCQEVLFPDTPYTNESGGDPEVIPTLTYADFLRFHSTYYHPSNSFIYLYGDLNVEEQLNWLDREYLCKYDARPVFSRLPLQQPFDAPREITLDYPLAEEESPEGKAYLSCHWVTGQITDPKRYVAFQVLEAVLLGMPGAPLKQALQDAELAEEILGGCQNSSLQPYFSVIAKNADESRREEFLSIVRETLTAEVERGLDRKALEAALNNMEFKNREADYGPYPKGLIYGIQSFDSWLYQEDPAMHLKYEKTFAFLREQLGTSYYEDLVKECFLNNPHSAVITLHAVPGLTERKEKELAGRLAEYKASLTKKEILRIVKETAELKAFQEEPSAPEAVAALPVLSLEDISTKARPLMNREKTAAGIPVIHHEIFTGGIEYLDLLFGTARLEKEDIPFLGLLRAVLGMLPTEHFGYRELASEISLHTGGISFGLPAYQNMKDPAEYSPYLDIHVSVLRDKLPKALELMGEILFTTDFMDEKRLKELILEIRSRVLTTLQNGGHSTAVLRASSYGSAMAWYNDQIGGIGFMEFLTKISEKAQTPEGLAEIGGKLAEIASGLFVKEGLVASLTAETGDFDAFSDAFSSFAGRIPEGGGDPAEEISRTSVAAWEFEPDRKQEGFKTAAQIQYVALSGNYRRAGLPYTGTLRVLRKILGDEYLWVNVRVKGGAYGCMCSFGRSGGGFFVSYRDPNLRRTLEVFRGIPEYLEKFDVSDRDMTNYVIGTIGTMDRPMNPAEAGVFSLQGYMSGVTQDMIQQDRDEVLKTDQAAIRSMAVYMKAIVDTDRFCVVGNAANIEEAEDLFGRIVTLA